ncbi:MAG TPA: AbrB/MazE/SpoVT family DNA-binding domain-containing protein [Planctomycetota bacterium]|nr:AbrB/MazE/SpoVT family DNA-binding domain-containing protein [Planctomycetota bacterium]
MVRASLSTRGQLVIPKAIRERLGLRAGAKVDIFVQDNGDMLLRPAVVHVQSLRGCLKPPKGKVASLEDMERAIREGAAKGL